MNTTCQGEQILRLVPSISPVLTFLVIMLYESVLQDMIIFYCIYFCFILRESELNLDRLVYADLIEDTTMLKLIWVVPKPRSKKYK